MEWNGTERFILGSPIIRFRVYNFIHSTPWCIRNASNTPPYPTCACINTTYKTVGWLLVECIMAEPVFMQYSWCVVWDMRSAPLDRSTALYTTNIYIYISSHYMATIPLYPFQKWKAQFIDVCDGVRLIAGGHSGENDYSMSSLCQCNSRWSAFHIDFAVGYFDFLRRSHRPLTTGMAELSTRSNSSKLQYMLCLRSRTLQSDCRMYVDATPSTQHINVINVFYYVFVFLRDSDSNEAPKQYHSTDCCDPPIPIDASVIMS